MAKQITAHDIRSDRALSEFLGRAVLSERDGGVVAGRCGIPPESLAIYGEWSRRELFVPSDTVARIKDEFVRALSGEPLEASDGGSTGRCTIGTKTIKEDEVLRNFLRRATLWPYNTDKEVRLSCEDGWKTLPVPEGLAVYGSIDGCWLVVDMPLANLRQLLLSDREVAQLIFTDNPQGVVEYLLKQIHYPTLFVTRDGKSIYAIVGCADVERLLVAARYCAEFNIDAELLLGSTPAHVGGTVSYVRSDEIVLDIPGTHDSPPKIDGWWCIRAKSTGGRGHTYLRYWRSATPERLMEEFQNHPRSKEFTVKQEGNKVIVYSTAPGKWIGTGGRWLNAYRSLGVEVDVRDSR